MPLFLLGFSAGSSHFFVRWEGTALFFVLLRSVPPITISPERLHARRRRSHRRDRCRCPRHVPMSDSLEL